MPGMPTITQLNSMAGGRNKAFRDALAAAAVGALAQPPTDSDKIACPLCRFRGTYLANHVRVVHGLTASDYRSRFPGLALIAPALSKYKTMRRRSLDAVKLPDRFARLVAGLRDGHRVGTMLGRPGFPMSREHYKRLERCKAYRQAVDAAQDGGVRLGDWRVRYGPALEQIAAGRRLASFDGKDGYPTAAALKSGVRCHPEYRVALAAARRAGKEHRGPIRRRRWVMDDETRREAANLLRCGLSVNATAQWLKLCGNSAVDRYVKSGELAAANARSLEIRAGWPVCKRKRKKLAAERASAYQARKVDLYGMIGRSVRGHSGISAELADEVEQAVIVAMLEWPGLADAMPDASIINKAVTEAIRTSRKDLGQDRYGDISWDALSETGFEPVAGED